MATKEEVKKLAALARIRIDDAELEKFTKEFDAILAYVGQLEKLDLPKDVGREKPPLRNVMRDDGEPRLKSDFERGEPHSANDYTPALIEQFPASAEATAGKPADGAYLVVKQIISHD